MNDTSLTRMKIAVERAVRPLLTRQTCKRRMRQEMLAHLIAVHAQEMKKLGNDEAATDHTLERFGDPQELLSQLQEGLRWWDRVGYRLDEIFEPKPGESTVRLAVRPFMFMLLAYAVILAVMLPILLLQGKQYLLLPIVRMAIVTSIVATVLHCLLITIPIRLGRILYSGRCRRPLVAVLPYVIFSLAVFPLLAFFTFWGLTGDLKASFGHFQFGCLFAPAAPAVFLLMTKPIFEETSHRQEWDSLEIG